jgi:hypothetical protein
MIKILKLNFHIRSFGTRNCTCYLSVDLNQTIQGRGFVFAFESVLCKSHPLKAKVSSKMFFNAKQIKEAVQGCFRRNKLHNRKDCLLTGPHLQPTGPLKADFS